MEITNSTIFIKMLQKLRENPHFKIVELILCAFFAYSGVDLSKRISGVHAMSTTLYSLGIAWGIICPFEK